MKLIVGLGNPEQRYTGTRHNVGFFVLDQLATQKWRASTKFKANITELTSQALLVKPTTYYNLIGQSVQALASFYKVEPQDILLIHDDHALPLGTIRTRLGGSSAGNNGIASITEHVGDSTARLRIGTHTSMRENMDDSNFVLGKFTAEEQKVITSQLLKITDIVNEFLNDNFSVTTHK